jgi:D-alanyl-D-alanine carboxypeptidase (penicillin-binding protein 5/6)
VALAACCLGALAGPATAGASGGFAGPRLSARAAALIEQQTGEQLVGLNENARVPIASTTKLMTALLTLEQVPHLETQFPTPAYYLSPADSQIGLRTGERMSVHDLLLALLLPSADDAAYSLAYNLGHGSVDRFIVMMNARARELGLSHTHYSTPSGLDTPGNYSTAADLVKLASFVLTHHKTFARIVALPHATLNTGDRVRDVANRNDLVGRVPGVNGVKTGHTLSAGYVLVGSGTRDGMTLISVALGTPTPAARDADTMALLDWGFAHARLATPIHAGDVLARPTVKDQSSLHPEVIAATTFTRVVPRAAHLSIKLDLPKQLAGPLRARAAVGTVEVLVDGRRVGTVRLLLAHAVPAVSPLTKATNFITRPSTLVLLVVLLGGAAAVKLRRRGQTRHAEPEPST